MKKVFVDDTQYECDLPEKHDGPHEDCRFYDADDSFRTVEWWDVGPLLVERAEPT